MQKNCKSKITNLLNAKDQKNSFFFRATEFVNADGKILLTKLIYSKFTSLSTYLIKANAKSKFFHF